MGIRIGFCDQHQCVTRNGFCCQCYWSNIWRLVCDKGRS
jgi:hypothetical protein